jgi:hypothetical protein
MYTRVQVDTRWGPLATIATAAMIVIDFTP